MEEQSTKFKEMKGKGKRGLLRVVFGRTVFFFLFLILQLAVFFWLYGWLDHQYQIWGYGSLTIVSAILGIYILNTRQNASFKMSWLVMILALPVFGILFYVFVQLQMETRLFARRSREVTEKTDHYLSQDSEVFEALKKQDRREANLCHYLKERGGCPVWNRTHVTYFPLGDFFYPDLLKELKKARRYIFIEYFIIQRGIFWDSVLEILKVKASEGVEVRVLYDGMNVFSNLPHDYPMQLEEMGIHCRIFNPIRPAISTSQNNRDHRKILVIDGHTAYTGGVNLADEYINRRVRFGHWKDNAMRLKGDAVKSFTVMFLQMWDMCDLKGEGDYRYETYLNPAGVSYAPEFRRDGFVVPFTDSPIDGEPVGHQLYLDILYQTKNYVYIMTPYLVLDDDMITALTYAAKRGVDTVLILPHIPDKKYAFYLAHSYYEELMEAGVQIYEYMPGFVHAKTMVSDGEKAVVGTVNMDFRSQYLNFECGVYLYDMPVIGEIRRDFELTIKKCEKMTMEKMRAFPIWQRIFGKAMRLVAPLM